MSGVISLDNTFHERLRHLRTIKGLSQKFVAEKIGVKNNTLSGYESGRREPDTETLVKLADLYEVSLDYLLRGEEYKSEAQKILDDPNSQIAARDGDPDAEETLRLIQEILEKQKKEK